MTSRAARRPAALTETQQLCRDTGRLLSSRIWIPKTLYAVLPWFYLAAGVAALLATVYISQWFWVLPHYLLFSAACLHLGLVVMRRRRRHAD